MALLKNSVGKGLMVVSLARVGCRDSIACCCKYCDNGFVASFIASGPGARVNGDCNVVALSFLLSFVSLVCKMSMILFV